MDKFNIFLSNVSYLISFFENNPIDLSINLKGNKINIQSYPKFLTNPQLFNRQLNDSSFRRIILLQIIIVYNSFLRPISTIQKKFFVFNNQTIDIIKKDINRCVQILSKAKNKNLNIMEDEITWENWKEKNCPPFEKEPDENLINIINNNNNINNNNKENNENEKEENKKIKNIPKLNIENSNMNAFNFDEKFKTNLIDIKNIKVNFKIDNLNSEVPFIGTYLNAVLDDADVENELLENEKIINRDSSFSWKFLRLLSQNDICKLNIDGRNKVLLICENLYNQYKSKDDNTRFVFKPQIPNVKILPKETISLSEGQKQIISIPQNKDKEKDNKEKDKSEEKNENKNNNEEKEKEKEKDNNINIKEKENNKEKDKEIPKEKDNIKEKESISHNNNHNSNHNNNNYNSNNSKDKIKINDNRRDRDYQETKYLNKKHSNDRNIPIPNNKKHK